MTDAWASFGEPEPDPDPVVEAAVYREDCGHYIVAGRYAHSRTWYEQASFEQTWSNGLSDNECRVLANRFAQQLDSEAEILIGSDGTY